MNKIYTSQELKEIQQPLNKKGKVNEYFNKLYGTDKNPCVGTEFDENKERRQFIKKEIDKKLVEANRSKDYKRVEKLKDFADKKFHIKF